MENLASAAVISALMRQNGISPNKRLGQNFLIDGNVIRHIADIAGVSGMNVLEIGPGMGALTQELAARAEKVAAVEVDSGFARLLLQSLSECENVHVIHGDIMKKGVLEIAADVLGGSFSVCANLPYYITSPVIMLLLQSAYNIRDITLMVQKEVAARLSARPGNSDYGILSIAAQYYADIKLEFTVPPGCFMPKPKVDSAVIRLITREEKIRVPDEQLFFKVVRASFSMRRKTIQNNLSGLAPLTRESAAHVLEASSIDPTARAETLSITEFARLTTSIFNLNTVHKK